MFALQQLLPELLPGIDNIAQAFGRSEYMCTMDPSAESASRWMSPRLRLMQQNWKFEHAAGSLPTLGKQYGTYPDGKRSEEGFENYLDTERILPFWPRTEKTGAL